MKHVLRYCVLLASLALIGCSTRTGSATVGALGGAAAGGGAYEYRLHREMQRIEDEHKAKKMDDKEYDIRKDQIKRIQLLN